MQSICSYCQKCSVRGCQSALRGDCLSCSMMVNLRLCSGAVPLPMFCLSLAHSQTTSPSGIINPPEIGDLLNFIFPSIHCTWQVLNKAYLINFRIMYLLLLPGALIFLFKSQHPLNLSVNILCSLQASS